MKNRIIWGLIMMGYLVTGCKTETTIEEKLLSDIIFDLTQPAKEYVVPPVDSTEIVTLVFEDTLVRPVDYYLKSTNKVKRDEINEDHYKLLEHLRSGNYQPTIIDISIIQGTKTLKIVSDNQINSDDRVIGILVLSPIIISDNKDYGVFLSRFKCKGDCGYSEIIFVENIDDRWKVANRIVLGIS